MKKQKISLQLGKQKISSLAEHQTTGGNIYIITDTKRHEQCFITEMTQCGQSTCNTVIITTTATTNVITRVCNYQSRLMAC